MRIEAASEPLWGSVVASAVIGGSSPASGSSQRRFCTSEPSTSTGSAKNPLEVIRLPIPLQPCESSSCTMHEVRQSVIPAPPYSSGSMNEVRPSSGGLAPHVPWHLGVGLIDGQ